MCFVVFIVRGVFCCVYGKGVCFVVFISSCVSFKDLKEILS